MAAEKRRSHGWQAFGSYTYSRASGLQVSSGATAAASQVSTIAGIPYLTFGQDPNSLTNARGRLPNDRPHMLRVMGSVDVPRTGFVVAANVQHFTGKPWAATRRSCCRRATQRILLEPRGSRRLSSQTLVDLRVSRADLHRRLRRASSCSWTSSTCSMTRRRRGWRPTTCSASNFGQPNVFIDPRRAMLGVRLNLGR